MSESGEPMNVSDRVDVPGSGVEGTTVEGTGVEGTAVERTTVEEGPRLVVRASREESEEQRELVFDVRGLSVYYGSFPAIRDITLPINRNEITALIGPSGCGKTTFLRCLNRMNDLIETARV